MAVVGALDLVVVLVLLVVVDDAALMMNCRSHCGFSLA